MKKRIRRLLVIFAVVLVLLGGPWFVWRTWWSGDLLAQAYRERDFHQVEVLLTLGARIDWIPTISTHPYSVILRSISGNDMTMLRRFLKAGGSPDFAGGPNTTIVPLFMAISTKNMEALAILIEQGADLSYRNRNGETFLHHAAFFNPKALAILLQHDIDVNVQDVEGNTPLHEASRYPRKAEASKILLRAGADPELPNGNGKTPLDIWPALADIVKEVEGKTENGEGK